MTRPKFFRDPVHVQLRFENVNVRAGPPDEPGAKQRSWLIRRLIDSSDFQRLRFIRQNGLANLVFHGAEHSRFTHSVGVAHLANEMFDRICRNTGETGDEDLRLRLSAAALLHDVGHGPFSHTLEEILRSVGTAFDHEKMTVRIIEEPGSSINEILQEIDPTLPGLIAAFIDKSRRTEDHWTYRIVSSQLDADRLDYLLRDAMYAGIKGHGFDLPRLLDLLYHHDGKRIAVERGAIGAVEAYLFTLDQLYRMIYYHHAVRAANFVLTSILRRAVELHGSGEEWVFPNLRTGVQNPFSALIERGQEVELSQYVRLGEHHVWALMDYWIDSEDSVLKDLAQRLMRRRLFKTKWFNPLDVAGTDELRDKARALAIERLDHVDESNVTYYVGIDQPERTSYKRYDWRAESSEESIWMIGEGREPCPIEDDDSSRIVAGLKETRYFPRLIVPEEIRDEL